ncbi:MAG: putative amidohydrolase YtcJ [Parasphingorhabdus sp.]|jgi:predicted amidohydrolase YtcJ
MRLYWKLFRRSLCPSIQHVTAFDVSLKHPDDINHFIISSNINRIELDPLPTFFPFFGRFADMNNPQITLITGGRLFTADADNPWAEAIIIRGSKIDYVGDLSNLPDLSDESVEQIDLQGGLVVPGFVDGHVHVAMTGAAMLKAQLQGAGSLHEILRRVQAWADVNPDEPRVLGTSWVHSDIPDAAPTRQMLDDIVSDRPVYLEAFDYHSSWVNTAALEEMGIDNTTPDPIGGRIVRDSDTGKATGYLLENASVEHVWSLLGKLDDEVLDQHLNTALNAFSRAGITSVVEMALEEPVLQAMARARDAGLLKVRIVAHMIIWRTGNADEELALVHRAAELAREYSGDLLRVCGIKIISDGTIDNCTAALSKPYTNGESSGPIWGAEALNPVVAAADELGLQVAIHAIGDEAIHLAVDSIARAQQLNNSFGRRHRIEHLEYARQEDIDRMGQLGITASMQPLHVDPEFLQNWQKMIGPERANQGWAWPLYRAAGSTLAFGTDTPTAPYLPLINMYLASTRKSPTKHHIPALRPDWALTLEDSIMAGTRESAWAAWLDHIVGTLKVGMAADLVVLDRDVLAEGPQSLLETNVRLTMINGQEVYRG